MGPIEISTTDLLGIYKAKTFHGYPEKLMIYPKTHDLRNFQTGNSYLTNEGLARKKSNTLSPHASSVREYAYGDSLSRIHWKSTARSRRLMSKEFDVNTSNEVIILNDMDSSVHLGELEESTLELSISLVASLCKKYSDSNIPVGLLSHGAERYFLAPGIGHHHFDRTMELLAGAQTNKDENLHQVLTEEKNTLISHPSMIVITPSTEVKWIENLSDLSQFATITVMLIDPISFSGNTNHAAAISSLTSIGISPYLLEKNTPIENALSQPFSIRANLFPSNVANS